MCDRKERRQQSASSKEKAVGLAGAGAILRLVLRRRQLLDQYWRLRRRTSPAQLLTTTCPPPYAQVAEGWTQHLHQLRHKIVYLCKFTANGDISFTIIKRIQKQREYGNGDE